MDRSWLRSEDVVGLARQLLGCEIVSSINGKETTGYISETEAYRGPEDKASHAWNGRRTDRTTTMYGAPGTAYIYLCYGIHHLFNVVTGPRDVPHAVLIRGIIPASGVDVMKKRRGRTADNNLLNGPGKWTRAFGITTALDGIDLLQDESPVRLRSANPELPQSQIEVTPRIGIDYAEEWAVKPWRFVRRHDGK